MVSLDVFNILWYNYYSKRGKEIYMKVWIITDANKEISHYTGTVDLN